jgi:hypothetical protein
MFILSFLLVALVALGIFVPIFIIALVMLKSPLRALSVAAVFALGSTAGFILASMLTQWAVGHAIGAEWRGAFIVAFTLGGTVAGGVLAVSAIDRGSANPPWRRQ